MTEYKTEYKEEHKKNSEAYIEQKGKFSPQQWKAIKLSRKLGKQIAQDYPEIANNYKSGMTMLNIAKIYNFISMYEVPSIKIMKEAMRGALEKLISTEELKILASEHRREWGKEWGKETLKRGIGLFSIIPEENLELRRKGGQISYEKGIGVHALSSDEKKEAGRKGGLISGRKVYDKGLGIHALTLEERREAGRKGALVRGQQLWLDEEKQYFLRLCKNPEYQYNLGPHMGCPNYKLISDELERKFGIRRTLYFLSRTKQKLKKLSK